MEPSSDISIESIEDNLKSSFNRVRKRKKQLYADLKKLMEFYLSDANLRKDRYFAHLMQTSQCISIETFLNCNKIKNLTTNPDDIIKAIESSNVLAVSDCKTKIYRTTPIKEKLPEEIERCTVYVEQLPPKADHDWVKSIFEKYGSVAYISLPKFKSGTIKRFAFVEFDNEESAKKVLEDYQKLHEESKILPEELQSIITFKEDEDKNVIDENTENISLVIKEKNSFKVDDDKNDIEKSAENINSSVKRKHSICNEVVKEKKIKKEVPKGTCIGTKNIKKKKKKDKHKKSDLGSEQKNDNIEIIHNDTNLIAEIKENLDSSIEKIENAVSNDDDKKESNMESNNDSLVIKKKRKRNKGKKVKVDTNISELRIMSKTQWKKLRNQFLNMQRQKMSLLKAQLRRPRCIENTDTNSLQTDSQNIELEKPQREDVRVKYEPGVILKISFLNPIECDKIFKAEAKSDSNVKFVDIINSSEAYIRCSCQESAKKIAEENRWPQTIVLKGEEERLYWEKILRDREIKCMKQKGTKKLRGRVKLINKAEKRLAQHVKFNTDND